jgi:hypothetical protein
MEMATATDAAAPTALVFGFPVAAPFEKMKVILSAAKDPVACGLGCAPSMPRDFSPRFSAQNFAQNDRDFEGEPWPVYRVH